MRRTWVIRALVVLAVLGLTGTAASADSGANVFATSLSGFNEVPPILSDGSATVVIVVHGDSLTYRETFSGTFSSNVTQSHLHFAERGVNGGVFLFLCSNLGNGPAGTPACPQSGTVTRTVTAADFIAVTAQNVPAGNFQNAVRILRSGDTYANIHTVNFPAGEIRGQVHFGDD
jgi:CHRD domain